MAEKLSYNEQLVNDWCTKKLWEVNHTLANNVIATLNDSGIFDNIDSYGTDELMELLSNITRNEILQSEGDDNLKVQLIKKLGVSELAKLDWQKLVDDGEINYFKPITDEDRIKMAAKHGYQSVNDFNSALTKAREEWAKKQNAVRDRQIIGQREYLYFLTLGDDSRMKNVRDAFKDDKYMQAFFNQADEEMNGIRGWTAAGLRNLNAWTSGSSVFNKYANDVRSPSAEAGAHENSIFGGAIDYPRQFGTDVVYGAASQAASIPVMKAITAVPGTKAILGSLGANTANGVAQGGLEYGRQLAAGEDLDIDKAKAVGVSQATAPFALEMMARWFKGWPVLQRLLSRERRKSLEDPVATKKQEMINTAGELETMASNPELNRQKIEMWSKDHNDLVDKRIEGTTQVKELQAEIKAKKDQLATLEKNIKNTQRRLSRSGNRIANEENPSASLMQRHDDNLATLETLNQMKAEQQTLMSQIQEAERIAQEGLNTNFNRQVDAIKIEAKKMRDAVAAEPSDVIDRHINTHSDDAFTLNKYEEQLYPLYAQDVQAISHIPTRLEKMGDVIADNAVGYVSNQGSRNAYDNQVKHPSYTMSKEERWEDIGPTLEERDSEEYYEWYCNRYGVKPEMLK